MSLIKQNKLKTIAVILIYMLSLNGLINPLVAFARPPYYNCPSHKANPYKTLFTDNFGGKIVEISNMHVHQNSGDRKNRVGCRKHMNVKIKDSNSYKLLKNFHIWKQGDCWEVWESVDDKVYKKCNKDLNEVVQEALESSGAFHASGELDYNSNSGVFEGVVSISAAITIIVKIIISIVTKGAVPAF